MNKKIALIILITITFMLMEVFRLTAFQRTFSYISLVFGTFGHVIYFIYFKKFPKEFAFWYSVGLLMWAISIISAYVIYDQSFISGFVANIILYEIGLVSLFWYIFSSFKFQIINLFSNLKRAAWIYFSVLILMYFFDYAYINISEITGEIITVDIGKLNKGFLSFIAIYFFSKFLYKSDYKYLLFSIILFLPNHLVEIQRFNLLLIILVLIISMSLNKNKLSNIKFILPFLIMFLPMIIIYFNISESFSDSLNRFQNAFKIFYFDGESINDSSTASRLVQTEYAIEKFKEYPIFGNGLFRQSESQNLFGNLYFHVTDVGVFGILYCFGVFGILIFLKQILYLRKLIVKGFQNYYQFFITVSFLYLIINSIVTQESIYFFKKFLFYVFLCHIIYSIDMQDDKI